MTTNKTYLLLLILTVAFGAYLRFYNLGVPSFWVDELDFVEAAKSQSTIGKPLLASGYAYPRAPLLTRSLMGVYSVFGVSEFSSRLPSALFGLLTIPLVFYIGRAWFGTRAGLFAAIFLACAPFEIGWSRACRMYALFQLLFLAGMYLFYRGFEAGDEGSGLSARQTTADAGWLRRFSTTWEINLPVLFAGGVCLILSYTSHQNAGLFLFSFLAYALAISLSVLVPRARSRRMRPRDSGKGARPVTKHIIVVVSALLLFLAASLMPQVQEFAEYAFGFEPRWAATASAQNRWRVIEFLFGAEHFPTYLLFAAGALLLVLRGSRPGLYSLMNLAAPVLMFTFLFKYRKNDYIYHVYPVVFLLAGYALSEAVGWLERHVPALQDKASVAREDGVAPAAASGPGIKSLAVLCLSIAWLPLTAGFRFAQKIPRLPDGHFNGAIYHNEWKEVAARMAGRVADDDIVISTLPFSIQYYLGRADYNLNWSNREQSRQNNFVAEDGRFIDLYSGTDIIDTKEELQQIMAEDSGWFVADTYRLNSAVYVPADIRRFIKQNMVPMFETKRQTVAVFRWQSATSDASTN